MLEAIIAFMPIQEDHQAIGALNYPIETRKKFALASKDYKCDVCGPVKKIVEDNFKKDIIDNSKKDNNLNCDNSDSDKKNKKENIVEKVVLLDDKIKSGFNKENYDNDFDKENNEDLENKNEEKKNDMDNLKVKNSKVDDDINLKKNKSENINFSEEFKKLRQSQYENILKKTKSDNLENKKEKDDNKFLKIEKKKSKENILNEINEEENINNIDNNLIESEFNDEVDFNIIQNTIKFHGNKTNEEIENELKNNFQNKNLLNQFIFNKNIKEQIPFNKNIIEDDDNINDNEFTKKIKHLTYEKKVLEKFLKKKISFVKYCSRKTYEKERDKEIRNFTIVMGILVILVFFIYFIFHKLF